MPITEAHYNARMRLIDLTTNAPGHDEQIERHRLKTQKKSPVGETGLSFTAWRLVNISGPRHKLPFSEPADGAKGGPRRLFRFGYLSSIAINGKKYREARITSPLP